MNPSIIQSRTAGEVFEAAKAVVEKGKKLPGRFIFSPGYEMPAKAPLVNVKMMTKAVEDFGR